MMAKLHVLLSFLVLVCAAAETTTYRSENGLLTVTLELKEFVYTDPTSGLSFVTRAFNNQIPAPTLRVFPGDSLVVTLKNSLGANAKLAGDGHLRGSVGTVDCTNTNCVTLPQLENNSLTYANPNSTNLHTHGLHIDSHEPGDNVLDVEINPGDSYTYTYHIPGHHMEGTYWYHPHLHGSSTVQTGGGVAGYIIVDPLPAKLSRYPPWLKQMTGTLHDQQVMLQTVPFSTLRGVR
jgi:FtsP/CotA-like multicopper oxidase with cupredoxin domain